MHFNRVFLETESRGEYQEPGYIQVWDPTSAQGEKRFVMPSPHTVRKECQESKADPSDRRYHPQFGDEFCIKWRDFAAYIGQNIMRARHFALVGTSRKELSHIRRIKSFQGALTKFANHETGKRALSLKGFGWQWCVQTRL